MRTKAIIFDLEGVIIDSMPLWRKADEEFLKRHGFAYNYHEWEPQLAGRSLVDGAGIIKEKLGLKEDAQTLARVRKEIAKELLKSSFTFINGFESFFAKITRRFKTAVATGIDKELFGSLDERFCISSMFKNHVYSIDDIGRISKPNPDIFLYAAKKLGVLPANSLVIEDSPNGVEAAKRAGMQCIAITTSTSAENLSNADLVVDTYDEISLSQLRE